MCIHVHTSIYKYKQIYIEANSRHEFSADNVSPVALVFVVQNCWMLGLFAFHFMFCLVLTC